MPILFPLQRWLGLRGRGVPPWLRRPAAVHTTPAPEAIRETRVVPQLAPRFAVSAPHILPPWSVEVTIT